jgi:hypothetical protein
MSFDIFMTPFENSEPLTFSRLLILEIFGTDAELAESGFSQIRYSEDDGAEIYGAEEEIITDGLSFNHCGGKRFFDGLWRLADRTNAVIFWPGDEGNAVVTGDDALAHADPEFIEPLQPVKIVSNGEELLDYMAEHLS